MAKIIEAKVVLSGEDKSVVATMSKVAKSVEGLAKSALDPETKTELRFRCFSELAQYIYPKRKAIEIKQSEHVPELNDEGLPVPAEFRDRGPRI